MSTNSVPRLSREIQQQNEHSEYGSEGSGEKGSGFEDVNLNYLAEKTGVPVEDVEAVGDMAAKFDLSEARQLIHETVQEHRLDPNFPKALLQRAVAALGGQEMDERVARALVDEIKVQAALMDDSPYPEVRAVVPNVDDPELPAGTFRMWVIGLIFTVIGTAINTFFSARNPGIQVNTFVGQLLAFPFGKALERILPEKTILGVNLNPGPFNMKEHMLITIMANVTFGSFGVYSTDIIFVQRIPKWFNQNSLASQPGYQIMLTLATQMIGFSLAGLTRRFLVYPPAMIWPTNLATIALNRSFHAPGNPVANGWRISRLRFFLIIFVAYSVFYLLPDALFISLSTFNWICWIKPNNNNLNIIAGQVSGLGLINPLPSFDWSFYTFLNQPLITPLFSTLNMTFGALVSSLLFIIPAFYSGTWHSWYLPINTNAVFDRFGSEYNVSSILGPGYALDEQLYEAYSPPYLSAGNAMVYAWFFAIYTATIVYVALHHHKEIAGGMKAAFAWTSASGQYTDVHNRLMTAYNEVPEWWFLSILVISMALGIAVVEKYHTDVPVWTLVFAVALALIFMVPIGIITAVSNVQVTLNVMAELIGGYALPGRPLANMIFKAFGFITTAQAVGYAGDLKLAHYTKLPPRQVFSAQMISSILASFVGLAVVDWQIGNIKDICTQDQPDKFSCPGYQTFFTAAVIWGTIGPKRMYSSGLYSGTLYGFLVGALLPIPFWYLARRFPGSNWKLFYAPAFLYGGINLAPYNFSYYMAGLWPAIIFMGYIRRRYLPWWSKYNYVLSTALSCATAIGGLIWFFAILFPKKSPSWGGNNIYANTIDGMGGMGIKTPPEDGFGPGPGQFSA